MEIILRKGRYALIDRGNQLKEIAVVYGLNEEKGEWEHTCDYWSYEYNGNPTGCMSKTIALAYGLELFRAKTEENYISRFRLEELCAKFKDALYEADEEYASDFVREECFDNEMEWLGIESNEEDDEYIPCAEKGDYSPSNPWDAPGMCISDFI